MPSQFFLQFLFGRVVGKEGHLEMKKLKVRKFEKIVCKQIFLVKTERVKSFIKIYFDLSNLY